MKVLPTSHSDELDVEVESPKALLELKEGDFSRFYGILDDYLDPPRAPIPEFQYDHDLAVLHEKSAPGPERKDSDFKKINLVFDELALDDLEAHCELDALREKFSEYCAKERHREEKIANTVELVKDKLVVAGTMVVTYSLGFTALFGYLPLVYDMPLKISLAAEIPAIAGLALLWKEMGHRSKVGKLEMIDDAKLHFVTHEGYEKLIDGRALAACIKEEKKPDAQATIAIETDYRDFFQEDGKFSTDKVVEKCSKTLYVKPPMKKSKLKQLKDFFSSKKEKAEEKEPGKLRILIYADENELERADEIQKKLRTHCRDERIKCEKNASYFNIMKNIAFFVLPPEITYGLDALAYRHILEVTIYTPLAIDSAADLALLSGLLPREKEMSYRRTVELLEKLGEAEVKMVPKGFYCKA